MSEQSPAAPCPICQGSGLVFRPSSRENKIQFLELCQCIEKNCRCDKRPPFMYVDEENHVLKPCVCRAPRRRLEKIQELYEASNIPRKYRYRRIEEFDTRSEDEKLATELAMVHDNAYAVIDHFQDPKGKPVKGLFLFGPPGSGKTFLACLILNELILRYLIPVKYVKITRDFFSEIRSTYSSESSMYGRGDDIMKNLSQVEVLVIDDFGVQADSAWEQRTLYDLIDARYENEKTTLITSNDEPAQIKNIFGGRVHSRLKEMTDFQKLINFDYRDNFFSER